MLAHKHLTQHAMAHLYVCTFSNNPITWFLIRTFNTEIFAVLLFLKMANDLKCAYDMAVKQ